MEARLLQLELSMDAAKRDIEELKHLVTELSFMVMKLTEQVNQLSNG